MKTSRLKPDTWKGFLEAYRDGPDESRPTLFPKGRYPGLAIDPGLIFSATVEAAEQVKNLPRQNRGGYDKFRFFIDGLRVADPVEYLMRAEDTDFSGWDQRLARQGVTDYSIVLNHLERGLLGKVSGIHDFLGSTVATLGMPASHAEVTLFAGKYEKTAFGVHTDSELNFYWPLLGPKRMRFWRPDYPDAERCLRNAPDYTEHLAGSTLLHAQPGDMMVWEGNWWHIGEGTGDFTLSLTIPLVWFPEEGKNKKTFLESMSHSLLYPTVARKSGAKLFSVKQNADTSEQVPPEILAATDLLREINPEDITDLLVELWLRKTTMFGLDGKQPINEAGALTEDDIVEKHMEWPTHWARITRGRICIAAGGNSITLPESNLIIEVTKLISSGRPLAIREVCKAVSRLDPGKKSIAATVLKVFNIYLQLGAIKRVEVAAELRRDLAS